jgi:hypothetical protein
MRSLGGPAHTQHLGHLLAHAQHGVESRARILQHHGNLASSLCGAWAGQVDVPEAKRGRAHFAARVEQTHQCAAHGALSRS